MDNGSKEEIILHAVEIVENSEVITENNETKFRVKDINAVYNQLEGKY